jgi:paraquat-inducible protein A
MDLSDMLTKISKRQTGIRLLGSGATLISFITFPFALWLPMLTSSKFVFSKHTFSLLSGLGDLFREREYPLFTLILLFCVITPTIKLLILAKFWIQCRKPDTDRTLEWISKIGRWSMIDVFMCAVLFVMLRLGITITITIHEGLYFFIATVLSSMIATECAHQWEKLHPESLTKAR